MKLDDLRHYQQQERQADSLQDLPDTFYEDAAEYVDDLQEQRDQAAEEADDPFRDDTVRRLSDELETAQSVIESIYERRLGKLVKAASFSAAGLSSPVDESILADRERNLFDDLVDRLIEDRDAIDPLLSGTPDPEATDIDFGSEDDTPDNTADTPPTETADTDASDSDAPAEDELEDAGPDDDVNRVMVRITDDVGEIFGIDERTYSLQAEDVVTLPVANAHPLIEKDAAEPLEEFDPEAGIPSPDSPPDNTLSGDTEDTANEAESPAMASR